MQDQNPGSPIPEVPEIARIPGAEERTATIEGVTWRYWFAGSGPALLLIHGFMGYSFSWRFNVAGLAQHFSVYAIDLPGCGFSQRTDTPECALVGDAEAVLRFMDHLQIEQADIVASSRGGGLTMVLAGLLAQRNLPHRVRKMVLVSPINSWSSYGKWLTSVLGTAGGGFCVLHVLPRLHFLTALYLRKLYGDARRISPGTVVGYRAGLQPVGSFVHLLRVVRSWKCDLVQIENSVPAIDGIPTLLLWGSRDRAVYPSSAPELHRRLKDSTLLVMEGVGHLPYEEVPAEFNDAVLTFLLGDAPSKRIESEQTSQEQPVPAVGGRFEK
ncbi:MAG: alpha/beta hydrolase [Acidobacteriota bacterium]|nr:alpha/beta hydrolase [Acidobacteriota bacterium]